MSFNSQFVKKTINNNNNLGGKLKNIFVSPFYNQRLLSSYTPEGASTSASYSETTRETSGLTTRETSGLTTRETSGLTTKTSGHSLKGVVPSVGSIGSNETLLYLIRHGESEYNQWRTNSFKKLKICDMLTFDPGILDAPLSSNGISQAKKLNSLVCVCLYLCVCVRSLYII
eukprot:GHVR01036067.1.p1 GENE.GHVR01036067.1~~GHVR01036067.1.p1  ORF type:complete len:172 (-),score=21.70 GHVR01036067.1:318-833(-)